MVAPLARSKHREAVRVDLHHAFLHGKAFEDIQIRGKSTRTSPAHHETAFLFSKLSHILVLEGTQLSFLPVYVNMRMTSQVHVK